MGISRDRVGTDVGVAGGDAVTPPVKYSASSRGETGGSEGGGVGGGDISGPGNYVGPFIVPQSSSFEIGASRRRLASQWSGDHIMP